VQTRERAAGTAIVRIVGTQVVCDEGMKDTWREVSEWMARQLVARFGKSVVVEYFDLFDPQCPPVLPDEQLPLVTVNDEVLSSGGKVSLPAIRRRLEELGVRPVEERGQPAGLTSEKQL
jgi:disulfide oxidoreductase YuzD